MKIKDMATGEIITIDPGQAGNYGISPDTINQFKTTQQKATTYTPGVAPGVPDLSQKIPTANRPSLGKGAYKTETPSSTPGVTPAPTDFSSQLADIETKRQQDYKFYPDKRADVDAQWNSEIERIDPGGVKRKALTTADIPSAEQKTADELKKTKIKSADDILSILDAIDSGRLTGDKAQVALNYAAGQYAGTIFKSGPGGQLTNPERAILAGTMPDIEIKEANWLQKPFGVVPQQTGKVLDTNEKLRNKMMIAKAALSGKNITDALLSETNTGNGTPLGKPQDQTIQMLSKEDPKIIAETILNIIPGGQYTKETIQKQLQAIGAKDPEKLKAITQEFEKKKWGVAGQDALKLVWGIPGFLAGKFGTPLMSISEGLGGPSKGSDIPGIGGLPILNTQSSFQQQYRDVKEQGGGEALSVGLPLLQWLFARKGFNEVQAVLPKIKADIKSKLGFPTETPGSAALKATKITPETIAKGEELSSKGLQMTKSNNIYDQAKEMPVIKAKAGQVIKDFIKETDLKKLGLQPVDEIKSELRQVLEMSDEGKTTWGKAHIDDIVEDVGNRIIKGELPGGMEKGEIYGTNLEAMDNTRTQLNAEVKQWYKNGRKIDTEVGIRSALKAKAALKLKDLIGEADLSPEGYFRKALEMQQVAIELEPELTEAALKKTSSWNKWQIIKNAFNAIMEPIDIKNARKMQGINPQYQKILNTPLSGIGPISEVSATMKQPQGIIRKPLEPQIINQVIKGKGPAQSQRLIKDTKLPGLTIRGEQESALRKASKKKYK